MQLYVHFLVYWALLISGRFARNDQKTHKRKTQKDSGDSRGATAYNEIAT